MNADRRHSATVAEQLEAVEAGPYPSLVPTEDIEPFVPSREDVEGAIVATARHEGRSVKSVRTAPRHYRCQECGAWLRSVGADEQRVEFRCRCGRSFPVRKRRMFAMAQAAQRSGLDYIEI